MDQVPFRLGADDLRVMFMQRWEMGVGPQGGTVALLVHAAGGGRAACPHGMPVLRRLRSDCTLFESSGG